MRKLLIGSALAAAAASLTTAPADARHYYNSYGYSSYNYGYSPYAYGYSDPNYAYNPYAYATPSYGYSTYGYSYPTYRSSYSNPCLQRHHRNGTVYYTRSC